MYPVTQGNHGDICGTPGNHRGVEEFAGLRDQRHRIVVPQLAHEVNRGFSCDGPETQDMRQHLNEHGIRRH